MVLYSADIMDVAQKVKSVKEKKPLTAKQLAAIEKKKAKEPVEEKVAPVEEPKKVVKKRVKKEKPVSVEEPKSLEEALEEALEEEEPKKRKRAPKKKDPALECFLEPKPVEEKVEEKPKRKRAKKVSETVKSIKDIEKEAEPPVWFKKYIEGVQREKKMQAGEKVAKKQLKEEAEGLAQKSWEDGLTRDRVHDELDNHMSRMHRMIFGR
jgi:hypothetical protein